MTRTFLTRLFFVCFVTTLIPGCGKPEAESAKAEPKGVEPESRVKRGAQGEAIITLDAETQKGMGLQTAEIAAAQLAREAKGYARVLDVSALGGWMTDLRGANIALESARQELARVKTLREQNNASEKSLQAAEATAAQAETNLRAIPVKIQAVWGKKLADLTAQYAIPGSNSSSADSLPAQLFNLDRVLVRADFPPGEDKLVGKAKLFGLEENLPPVEGQFFDVAPTIDPQTQLRGFFYLVDNRERRLAAGMSFKVSVPTTETPRAGVIVPREAIVRSEAKAWVYTQIEPTKFIRREVRLDQLADEGWFVTQVFKVGDKVIIAGAQQLLSEELKEQ